MEWELGVGSPYHTAPAGNSATAQPCPDLPQPRVPPSLTQPGVLPHDRWDGGSACPAPKRSPGQGDGELPCAPKLSWAFPLGFNPTAKARPKPEKVLFTPIPCVYKRTPPPHPRDHCLSSLNPAPRGIGAALPTDAGLSPEVKRGQPVFRMADTPSQSARVPLCLLSGQKGGAGGAHASVRAATSRWGGLCERCLRADLGRDEGGREEADTPRLMLAAASTKSPGGQIEP